MKFCNIAENLVNISEKQPSIIEYTNKFGIFGLKKCVNLFCFNI